MLDSLVTLFIGVAGGIWSDKFDHIAAVTNFVVTPLAFLSGYGFLKLLISQQVIPNVDFLQLMNK